MSALAERPRVLLPVVLAACMLLGNSQTRDDASNINAWLERWTEARACLVADAEDVETGVAIVELLGRTCDAPVDRLAQPFWSVPPIVRLTELYKHPSEPWQIAEAVREVDHFVRALANEVESPSRALPRLPEPRRLPIADYSFEFSGGLIRSQTAHAEVVMDERGHRQRFERDGGRRIQPGELVHSGPDEYIANAGTGPQRIVVWRPKSESDHAYEIDVTSDGKRWKTLRAPAGTTYLDSWQDPRTRAIEILVADREGNTTIHHTTAAQPAPTSRPADPASLRTSRSGTCAHGGRQWHVSDGFVAEFGERPLVLERWARAEQIDCRNDTVLITSHLRDQLERCRGRYCETVFSAPTMIEGRGALLEDGRWIYAAVLRDVVGVWREGVSAPSFYRLPKHGKLEAITVLRGRPHLVMSAVEDHRHVLDLIVL